MARKKRVSVRFIAERCGVSTATVSRVLNGEPGVADATRRLVEEALELYGYEAPRQAVGRRGPSKVGIIANALSSDYYGQLVRGVSRSVEGQGREAVTYDLDFGVSHVVRGLETLQGCGVDAIVFIGCPYLAIRDRLDRRCAHVWIDCNDPADLTPGICRVQSDQRVSGSLAARELLRCGHAAPILLGSSTRTWRGDERITGFTEEFAAAGVELPDDFVVETPGLRPVFDEARDIVQYLIAAGRPFDGIFAVSDWRTLAAYAGCLSQGRRVPEDIGIIGFDGSSKASRSVVNLSCIQQDVPLLVHHAVAQLTALLEGEEPAELNVTVPTTILPGQSL